MAKWPSRYYLYCQLSGWSAILLVIFCFNWLIVHRPPALLIGTSLTYVLSGLFNTHLLRGIIIKYQWLRQPPKRASLLLLSGIIVTSIAAGMTSFLIYSNLSRFIVNISSYLLMVTPWTMIYAGFHFVRKQRLAQLEKRQLEWRLKKKEELAQSSVVDVDYLTGCLENIRSMIDENPASARNELTAFSKLLRKGYLENPVHH